MPAGAVIARPTSVPGATVQLAPQDSAVVIAGGWSAMSIGADAPRPTCATSRQLAPRGGSGIATVARFWFAVTMVVSAGTGSAAAAPSIAWWIATGSDTSPGIVTVACTTPTAAVRAHAMPAVHSATSSEIAGGSTVNTTGTVVAKPDVPADIKTELRTEPKTDKDQARPQDGGKIGPEPRPMPGMAEFIGPIKPNTGQVAAFVSRKEGKLFVRQAFKPIFAVPVTIAPGDKPLGTHVFTVRSENDNKLEWTVISLPAPTRAAKRAEAEYTRKKKVVVDTGPAPTPSTATEALDRITIPDEAMKRLASVLAPGGSLVVSDEGLGSETGEGTDFIVHLR